ncbi:2-dehydro-3-deoxygalactonokinase [Sinorhizobium meliloti]|uniref:DgoK2 2-dehydro-3-deoxygalactonokinase n=1 Tax=Sinorhizobium meliloti (strain SM11) TaxID=707241 RepID=F7XFP9_SINMM|nr:2-dehydro-3-deoxygalactonokinase [Sinorhizobium meliloti]AEH82369.1 DgoK2 2-dehydro-3-deoxygalactonokinase [Sinorhizobium meliloti SM11]ARS66896.1 2-dehydro-3-deoxygalactonokinase [Sinorhizobium meliloti RU11/001]MBP2470057.1 2-dehydro-3-deoxygalactonokinase [Sinorhizobium meliloti]MDE3763206.1 2-dehydro-3-deoxygalactonokinase [Sinorhizobium meliloti]MDE3776894.1 2-dehydro-3-deoxygalactonokinase [Sinorhizobium meliloti]
MSNSAFKPVTVVLDWGTTGFRAFLVRSDGSLVDQKEGERGIQSIAKGEHGRVVSEALASWRAEYGPLDIVAAGMIGSRNGWIEMPYVPTPATPADLAAAARTEGLPEGDRITFLPGLTDPTGFPFPDVMRGEEAQLVGFGLDKDIIVVLPGTHAKWAEIRGGHIERFRTFVTGEIYATLADHSFLSKVATAERDHAAQAFAEGVALAQEESTRAGGLLTRLFTVRTGWLAGAIAPDEMKSRLSGLIIGWEFVEARTGGWFKEGDTIAVVGDDDLVEVYGRVAVAFGVKLAPAPADAAIRGALTIWRRHRLAAK